MTDHQFSLSLDRADLENVIIALEEREQYLKGEIRENERCDWLLTVEALKKDLASVRSMLRRLDAAVKGEGQ